MDILKFDEKLFDEDIDNTITVELVDELKIIIIKEMSSNDRVINTEEIVHKCNGCKFKMNKNNSRRKLR